jgi:hypothetical protein
MKEMINCTIPIKFPLKPNGNGICFTKEALEDIGKNFNNAPIIKNGNAIGVLSEIFTPIENDEVITLFVEGKIFAECYPEIMVNESENGVIKSFSFTGISI